MNPYFFYAFATITVLMVVLMILQKNPITGAMCLIVSFFSLAGLYVLLEAHFIAVLQILVYAGAIMVLFIFVIMFLNLKKEDLKTGRRPFYQFAALIASGALVTFLVVQYTKIPPVSFPESVAGFGTVEAIGSLMFSKYVIAFEVIGLLLLVGIIGAVLLGKKENHD
ncbi:MAG: NADH-quinone oxidoreductase subunit J [Deltaproteobacteria bacterium]|nr:NADH-quinone oxidoreductase subunit J [Deltaproteobacteria bacterium]